MQKPTRQYAYSIFTLLQAHYPNAHMILRWGNNFELLVAIILSAQCTDVMVNKVTDRLFPKYRKINKQTKDNLRKYKATIKSCTPEIYEIINFAHVKIQELEEDIRSTGFYHNKAKNVQGAAQTVLEKYLGILPKTIEQMITIPGVGRKTANVFLGNAYGVFEGIAVDTHVVKQSQLLKLTKNTKPDKIEQDLMHLFDQKDWFTLTYLLIEHGRNMRRSKKERITCSNTHCPLCSQ